ncbi:MAG: protein kinase, partial [Myxococcota bacterium]
MRLISGQQIGNYTLSHRLGAGGMAEVWAASHRVLGVDVALKVLFYSNPSLQNRLLREGRAQAAMDHPNILPVRDVVDVDGALGLILPLVKGPSLEQLLETYRPTLYEAFMLFQAIIEGVGHAHQRGWIHRDLKPGNVLLEERHGRVTPRVADFGLVKSNDEPGQTRMHLPMGTLNYAAPEQLLDASSVDHRADLFSLGVILVELLTGKLPFRGSSWGTLSGVYEAGPDLDGVPQEFLSLCLGLLAVQPDRRFSDCAAVLDALNDGWKMRRVPVLAQAGGLTKAIREHVAEHSVMAIAPETLAPDTTSDSVTFLEKPYVPINKERAPFKNNLPAELDVFIGRSAALQALQENLEESRLVSILGAGGIGKTRLALQYARVHWSAYPGGVFFCDLSDARTLEGLLFVVSQAMDVHLGNHAPLKQLGHAIDGHGACLLIFDNFEQIVEHAAETLTQWLKRAQAARFVVTSRVLLALEGEYPLRLDPLNEDEAVELFVERASKKKRGFALTAQNRDAIHQLVRLLDGLPLAIELATARIKVMKPEKLLLRMSNRFKLLAAGKRNTTKRQSTLRSAIDWSWTLLDAWEKAAFVQCAVFQDGFTLEAAEAVINLDDGQQAAWPMDAVQSLVDKSLLVSLGENRLGEMRFGMLMSIHDYAKEKFATIDRDAASEIHHRHLSFYAGFGEEEAMDSLESVEGVALWWALAEDVENLLAAHRFALKVEEVERAAQIASAVCQIAQRKQPALAIDAIRSTLNLCTDPHTDPIRNRLLGRLGLLYRLLGELELAEVVLTEALSITRAIGDRRNQGRWLGNLGALHSRLGQMEQAEAELIEALNIAKEFGDQRQESAWLGALGNLYRLQGQIDRAEMAYTETLSIARAIGDRRHESINLVNAVSTCPSRPCLKYRMLRLPRLM